MFQKNDGPISLSTKAFQELKQIVQKEYGNMPDSEITEMGVRLLKLFDLLVTHGPSAAREEQVAPSDQEFKALTYLHRVIYHEKRSPSVRDLCQAMDLRSSRSGFRLLNRLIQKGYAFRDEEKQLHLADDFKWCRTQSGERLETLSETA
jgi:sulfur relay (sulfurtransferase) DsrC/TusE family protein